MFQHTGLRFLLPYMRPYRQHLIIGTIYALIGAGASAYSPTLLGQAIDALQRDIRLEVLIFYALGLVGLAVLLALFRFLLRMLTGEIAAGVSYRMGQDLFERIPRPINPTTQFGSPSTSGAFPVASPFCQASPAWSSKAWEAPFPIWKQASAGISCRSSRLPRPDS